MKTRSQAEHAGSSAATATSNDKNAPEPVNRADEVAPVTAPTHDKAMISAADLASKHGVDYDPLRKRLERWRRQNHDTADWNEVMNRKPRDPQYLFREAAVMPIITELREAVKRSRNRKSG